MSLSKTQKARYSRNIKINQLQESGQQKLLSAKVLVIGAGGLGSPSIYYLAAAGVGTLGIADCDVVDISNLQRQIIHSSLDIGKPKIESASEKVKRLNPEVRVITYAQKITAATINDIIKHYDFIIDCTDNFFAKFLINDACVLNSKPFSYSGVISLHGQAMTYTPGSACLRCYAPTLPETPTGNDIGILGQQGYPLAQ